MRLWPLNFIFFTFLYASLMESILARRHRHFHQEPHFSKQQLETLPSDGNAAGNRHLKHHRRTPRIICAHGSAMGGRCVCDQGWAGTNCQRQMHCASFERSLNGSCTSCQPNYIGDRCERLECQNGGEESEEEQKCNCPKPYSGLFCEELLTKNVYYFYNSKVATLGPLGLLSVIPMIGIYVICERFARKRQVRRIEKDWNQQTHANVNAATVEYLLTEKC